MFSFTWFLSTTLKLSWCKYSIFAGIYSCWCCCRRCGRALSISQCIQPNSSKIPKRGQVLPKLPKSKIVEFPKSEPINRKFWNSRRKIKWKANSENLGVAWEVLFFYGNSGNCPLASIRHWKFPWNSKKNFSLTEKRLLFLNFKTVWFFRGFRLWGVFFYTLT